MELSDVADNAKERVAGATSTVKDTVADALPDGAKEAAATVGEGAQDVAEKVGESRAVEGGARLGYGASGLLHLLMGWITLRIAAGSANGDSADQTGAFTSIANTTGGFIVLWLLAVGFALLALWQLTESVIGAHSDGAGDRIKAISKAIMYAVLAWTAVKFAVGARSSSAKDTQDFTASFMGSTAGRLAIAAVGLGVLGVGIYHVIKGWKKRFLHDLAEHPPSLVIHTGRLGYIAKGIALSIVGGLFVLGAWHGSTEQTTGLDGALNTLRGGPVGTGLLGLVALGLMAFGVYSFGRARFTKV